MKQRILKLKPRPFFLLIFFSFALVASVVCWRVLSEKKENFVYVKIKTSPGAWWSRTVVKPGVWFLEALQKEQKRQSLNSPHLLELTYFPWKTQEELGTQEYEVYVTVKLRVGFNKKSGSYVYDDNSLLIGSPITVQFPSVLVMGTVVDISNQLRVGSHKKINVVLAKNNYSLWEYESIKIGERLFNGSYEVIKIRDKWVEADVLYLKLEMNLILKNNELLLSDEQIIKEGLTLNIVMPSVVLNQYQVISLN